MSKIRNIIVTISGEPASGKTSTRDQLAKEYEKMGYRVHIITAGEISRDNVKKEYLKIYPDRINAKLADIQADKSFATKLKEIDKNLDLSIKQIGEEINAEERPNDAYIIDARMAPYVIPDSYSVYLIVDEEIAGKRVYEDSTRGAEDSYKDEKEATEKTRQRKLGDIGRFIEQYGVDIGKRENYKKVIDTSYLNIQDVAQIIIEGEREYRESQVREGQER